MEKNYVSNGWYALENGRLILGGERFSYTACPAETVCAGDEDGGGLSAPYTEISAKGTEEYIYRLWKDMPLVWMDHYDHGLSLDGQHWVIRCVKLHAMTDDDDTLVTQMEGHMFNRNLRAMPGDIFYLEDPLSRRAVVIISEAPDYVRPTLSIQKGAVMLDNENNAVAIGFCGMGEGEAFTRNYYRHACKGKGLMTMSNTWGDRNGYSRVCEAFVHREIDAAQDIGVDIVQIDDGWQKGNTGDPAILDEQLRRNFLGDFWEPGVEKFPDGLKKTAEYAAQYGIRLGMWFAPDSHDNFALRERDAAVLRRAYEEWGVRFFKLDMYWVTTPQEQEGMLWLLKEIHSFGPDVAVQLDTTRDNRLNYLCGRQYGTIFVENRYTKSANAYPHRVLRNLWMLGQHLPTAKFQFELINPDLYIESYDPEDVLAPVHYDMDYLFASVMTANPLFWMEMQFLPEERRKQLKRILPVWKEHRRRLDRCDIVPVGEKPGGHSITGFAAVRDDRVRYLLVFREMLAEETGNLQLPAEGCRAKILASNTHTDLTVSGLTACVKLEKAGGYAFFAMEEE